jgi:hypothetical protein
VNDDCDEFCIEEYKNGEYIKVKDVEKMLNEIKRVKNEY